MKQISATVTIAILILTMISCRKESVETFQGSVEFSFDLSSQSGNTQVTSPTSALVSVEDGAGQSIYNNEKVNLTQVNGTCTTKPLMFEAGNYKLTKFMIIDADGNVLHATPMGFSSNASLVDNPLPIKFAVQKGLTTKLLPEVISTQSKIPQDLGYTSFKLNEQASFSFQLGVYSFNNDTKQFEATTALLSLVSDAGETFNQTTSSVIDTIKVKEAGKYILTVSKEGYQAWVDTLSVNDLLHYYSSPMAVTLDKTGETSMNFETVQDTLTRVIINLKSYDNSTPLRVNWGDGKFEVVTAPSKLTHDYAVIGNYNVKFTGNISSIYKLGLTHCQISSLNLDKADHLASIEISRNQKLKTLNLSEKHALKEVLCVEGSIENLNLTNSDNIELIHCSLNNLKSLDLSTLPNLKTLYCDRNKLVSLETKNNINLKILYCYQNALASLDLTNNSALETLDCRTNKLVSIDLAKSVNIKNILLGSNSISNDNANKMLVDLLQAVKANPRSGQISLNVTVKDAGQTSKDTLEKTYLWTVSTL